MSKKIIEISGQKIGSGHPPYIIAEMSANHNGSIEKAFEIIRQAAKAGANAVKLQTYTADTITLDCDTADFVIDDGLWAGQTLHELYSSAYTPWDWHEQLFDYAESLGIAIFSTPFDKSAVDLLEGLNAPAYKIASFEAIDLPLIKYVAATKKPMIISTGMADFDEISEAIEAAKAGGCEDLVVLLCVSGYPAPAENYNLRTLEDMRTRLDVSVGLSDHTLDNITSIASAALGACVIEKHLTLDRNGGGADDSFSLEPSGLADLCRDVRTAWDALGQVNYGLKSSESSNIKFRRSLYFVKDLAAGSVITADCVASIRPGYGLAPKYLEEVIGSTVFEDVVKGRRVSRQLIHK